MTKNIWKKRLALQQEGDCTTHLFSLLDDKDEKVRLLAVKNIGKLKSVLYLDKLYSIAKSDKSTVIRREATSSIGRMRNEKAM